MLWTPNFARSLGWGIVALGAAVAGCADQTPKGPPKVELSEGKVTISSTTNAVGCVRYRITQGRLRDKHWYRLTLSILAEGNNRLFDLYTGEASGLSTEGTVQNDCTIAPKQKAWVPGETVKYQFTLYEYESKDPRSRGFAVSNQLVGQTQVP